MPASLAIGYFLLATIFLATFFLATFFLATAFFAGATVAVGPSCFTMTTIV